MSQTERVLRIQQMLLERPSVSRRTFLEELEISPAQFKRDLSFLRDRFQLRIKYDPRRRGYVITPQNETADVQLPGPMYTAREIYTLLIMQDLIDQLQPGLLDEHLSLLRERLKLLLDRQDLHSDEIRRRIRILHMASRPVEPRFFRAVSDATFTRRRIAIRYYARVRDESTDREVSPQRLVFYRGNWYLDGWCHLRQDLRSFAVDAIQHVSITDKAAREVETAALDAHLGAGYGIFAGAANEEAVLRFEPAAARYVAAERWHARQTLTAEPSGHLILTVPFSNQQELVMDVLRYGPDVEVLAPKSLKDQVRVRLEDALQKYLRLFSLRVAHSVSHVLAHNPVMRFIHSADWQIGMRAVHAGAAADAVRAARLTTAARVCELAAEEAVDFLLLAGDTFEDNAVDRELVERVAGLLGRVTCPVYVLPGNHDPLRSGCAWEHAAWRFAPNVTILSDTLPIQVPGGVLLPCPLRARRSQENPTAWIAPCETQGAIRVVVAHGNAGDADGVIAEEGFPIPPDAPARTSADYVALGHWHSTVLFRNGGAPRMAYSGTPEPTRFGEPASGNVLVVEIAQPGAAPDIRTIGTAQLRWVQIGVGETITVPGTLADIARNLTQIPQQDKTLVEIVLTGLLFERDQDEIARIERACSRFLHARIDRARLRPTPEDQEWLEHLPAGAARIAANRLRHMASGNGADAETATQALLELYAFAQEIRS